MEDSYLKLVTPMEWISIKDRLPEQNQNVLIIDIHKRMATAIYSKEKECWDPGYFDCWDTDHCCGRELDETTHWMPLPEPPK
jgi:hypothetical protein